MLILFVRDAAAGDILRMGSSYIEGWNAPIESSDSKTPCDLCRERSADYRDRIYGRS